MHLWQIAYSNLNQIWIGSDSNLNEIFFWDLIQIFFNEQLPQLTINQKGNSLNSRKIWETVSISVVRALKQDQSQPLEIILFLKEIFGRLPLFYWIFLFILHPGDLDSPHSLFPWNSVPFSQKKIGVDAPEDEISWEVQRSS